MTEDEGLLVDYDDANADNNEEGKHTIAGTAVQPKQ